MVNYGETTRLRDTTKGVLPYRVPEGADPRGKRGEAGKAEEAEEAAQTGGRGLVAKSQSRVCSTSK